MAAPRFSILIPTKNRSEIVGGAIESALAQTYGDLEIIVSDNDDSESATRDAVAKYGDPRIRYFRTSGKLPMHENWENALAQAQGQWVLILEDKMRLVRNALEILVECANRFGNAIFSYDISFAKGPSIPDPPILPAVERWTTEETIRAFCTFSSEFYKLLPKSLDSCAPLELLRAARQSSPTGLVYSYVTPDYSSAFLLLSQVDSMYFIKAPLVYIPNNWMAETKYSVGQATYKKAALTARWLNELPVTTEEIQSYAPVKCKWLWLNNVLYDFFTKFKRAGVRAEIDWIEYHAFCVIIVILGKRMGANMQEEIDAIKASLRERSIGFKLRFTMSVARRIAHQAFLTVKRKLLG
ncbi:MAG TPA: glycosyltransferase family 2 protein [Verrucomicrobiae bacterium]